MQMVDSKQQQLSGEQIIEIAAENTNVGRPMKEVKEMLTIEFNMPNIWKMREGNTIFIVHKSKEPGYGFFRALNADTARNFVANSRIFVAAAYKVGFDVVVTQFNDPSLLGLFKVISRDPVQDGMGYVAQKTEDGGFQVTLQLGPAREHKK
jgi:hypothetical protein